MSFTGFATRARRSSKRAACRRDLIEETWEEAGRVLLATSPSILLGLDGPGSVWNDGLWGPRLVFNYQSRRGAPAVGAVLCPLRNTRQTARVSSSFFISPGEVCHTAGDTAFNTINNVDGGTDLSGLSMTCPAFCLTLSFIA